MRRLTLALGMVALAAVLAACSGTSAAEPTAAPSGATAGDATIVAKDIKFQQPQVAVKAGTPLAVIFVNQDGAPHNVKISDAAGKEVFKGDIVSNATVTYQVPALAAGTYTFICEVHPDMKGTITAQ
jgi:plastocyanin